MSVHKTWVEWLPHEDALLLQLAEGHGSVKTMMVRFPRHTYSGVCERLYQLRPGVTRAKKRADRTPSAVAILRVMKNALPLTCNEIAAASGVSERRTAEMLRLMRGKDVYISRWSRVAKAGAIGGPWVAMYSLGADADVDRPAPEAKSVIEERCRTKRRLAEQTSNPFAVVANQIIRRAA
jgi:hypothetical protein